MQKSLQGIIKQTGHNTQVNDKNLYQHSGKERMYQVLLTVIKDSLKKNYWWDRVWWPMPIISALGRLRKDLFYVLSQPALQ